MNLLHAHGSPTLFRTANGRHCGCACCCAASRDYHAANHRTRREQRREYNRDRWAALPLEQRQAIGKARYEKEAELRRRRQRSYYEAHRHDCIARNRRRRGALVGSHTEADVNAQYDRQRGRCYWCRTKLRGERGHYGWQVDHVVPVARGGSDNPENIVISCSHCNHEKSDRHPTDYAGMMF